MVRVRGSTQYYTGQHNHAQFKSRQIEEQEMGKTKSTSPPGTEVFKRHQEEFQRYYHLTASVQRELLADVEELRVQEGWDEEVYEGVRAWVDDRNSIWRLLRVCLAKYCDGYKLIYSDIDMMNLKHTQHF